jgi:molybdenum cofactor guanylyltransferase
MPTEPITAFILAGGKSTRMGTDKALLELAGRPLIHHALDLAYAITNDVRIVGDPKTFVSFGTVITDVYSACGPLAGIHAALASSATDWNLILGVDLPFLNPRFLNYLISEAQSSTAVVTVPSANGHFHPLCAVYRRQFGLIAERALNAARNKVDALFPEVSVRVIDEAQLVAAGFNPSLFRNLNTPDDLKQARQEFP